MVAFLCTANGKILIHGALCWVSSTQQSCGVRSKRLILLFSPPYFFQNDDCLCVKKPDLYFAFGAKFIFAMNILLSIIFGYIFTGFGEDFFVFHYFDALLPSVPLYAKHAYSDTAFKMVYYSATVNLILTTLVFVPIDLINASKIYDAISNKKAVIECLLISFGCTIFLFLLVHALFLSESDVDLSNSYARGRSIFYLLFSSPLGQGLMLGILHCLMYFLFWFSTINLIGVLRFWFLQLFRQ